MSAFQYVFSVSGLMRLGERFKHKFKWHFLTAFLLLLVIDIFNERFQSLAPAERLLWIVTTVVCSVVLGVFLFIGEILMDYVSKGLKRIKGFLLGK